MTLACLLDLKYPKWSISATLEGHTRVKPLHLVWDGGGETSGIWTFCFENVVVNDILFCTTTFCTRNDGGDARKRFSRVCAVRFLQTEWRLGDWNTMRFLWSMIKTPRMRWRDGGEWQEEIEEGLKEAAHKYWNHLGKLISKLDLKNFVFLSL